MDNYWATNCDTSSLWLSTVRLCMVNLSTLRLVVMLLAPVLVTPCATCLLTMHLLWLVAAMTNFSSKILLLCWTIYTCSSSIKKCGSKSNTHTTVTAWTTSATSAWLSWLMVISMSAFWSSAVFQTLLEDNAQDHSKTLELEKTSLKTLRTKVRLWCRTRAIRWTSIRSRASCLIALSWLQFTNAQVARASLRKTLFPTRKRTVSVRALNAIGWAL